MSFASKVTLGISVVFTTSIVTYVHWKQVDDKKNVHEGVLRDMERQMKKKNLNSTKEGSNTPTDIKEGVS